MFSNIMAIIQFLNLCSDVYLWIDGKMTDADFAAKMKKRKDLRNQYIATEKEELRLEILKELESNDRGNVAQ